MELAALKPETWVALGAVIVAIVGAMLNFWNVSRSIRHNTAENERLRLLEAVEEVNGLLVIAGELAIEIDKTIGHQLRVPEGHGGGERAFALLERAKDHEIRLRTLSLNIEARHGRVVVPHEALSQCGTHFSALVDALQAALFRMGDLETTYRLAADRKDKFTMEVGEWIFGQSLAVPPGGVRAWVRLRAATAGAVVAALLEEAGRETSANPVQDA